MIYFYILTIISFAFFSGRYWEEELYVRSVVYLLTAIYFVLSLIGFAGGSL